jgi:hypothetical protein
VEGSDPTEGGAMSYPARFTLDAPEKVANWRPLVHWFLALPHVAVAYVLAIVSALLAVATWFIVVFTGRFPERVGELQSMTMRYITRVRVYVTFLHSEYPPFDFTSSTGDPGGQPIRVDFVPKTENRSRLSVGLRIIWVIPALLYAMAISFVALINLVLAFFAVLFTGQWPAASRAWLVRSFRVNTRLGAYLYLLTDDYPPFDTH